MRRVVLIAGLLLAAPGYADEQAVPPPEKPGAPLAPEQFRAKFPLDEAFANAVLADYHRVQRTLMQKAANGARASVSLLTADGSVHSGYDEFFSSVPKSNREVRDNYVAVQVGTTACLPVAGKIQCSQTSPLRLGLFPIDKSNVARVWSADMLCLERPVPCRFIKIQTRSGGSNDNVGESSPIDPELVGHDYELLFTLSDHVPIQYKQTDHFSVGITATAVYVFDFTKAVAKIELPQDHE